MNQLQPYLDCSKSLDSLTAPNSAESYFPENCESGKQQSCFEDLTEHLNEWSGLKELAVFV
jgi:hypothetical protein